MTKKNKNTNLQTLSNNFIDYIKSIHSINTVSSYKQSMITFLRFCDTKNLTNVSKITIMDLHSFISYMRNLNNSPATINSRISCVKVFFAYLKTCKIIAEDISLELKNVKKAKKVQVALEIDESKEIIKLASQHKREKNAIRDELIIEMLLATGVRVSELVNIKHDDIKNNMLLVTHGKGDKQRTIPLSDYMINKINEYIEFKKEQRYTIDYLFVSTTDFNKKLSERAVQNIAKKLMIKVNRPELSTHKTRTTFATVLASQNIPIRTIGDLLGHGNNLTVTSGYIAPNAIANSQAIMSNPIFR